MFWRMYMCSFSVCMCSCLSHYIPVRTLMAPCTALTSPLTSISISKVNSCGQASGQSQWAMADTAYATLERTLLIASRRPLGSSSLMAALAWRGTTAVWQHSAQKRERVKEYSWQTLLKSQTKEMNCRFTWSVVSGGLNFSDWEHQWVSTYCFSMTDANCKQTREHSWVEK